MEDVTVYRVYTYHGTQMLMTSDGQLIHRAASEVRYVHLPVYARLIDEGLMLFVIKENKIIYFVITSTVGGGG